MAAASDAKPSSLASSCFQGVTGRSQRKALLLAALSVTGLLSLVHTWHKVAFVARTFPLWRCDAKGARSLGLTRRPATANAVAETLLTEASPALPPLRERTYLITGSTKGHGQFVAKKLLEAGCTVLWHGRKDGAVAHLMDTTRRELYHQGHGLHLIRQDGFAADLSDLQETRSMVELIRERYTEIHGILHNAATIDGDFTGKKKLIWNNVAEHTISANAFAPFTLTAGLMPLLQKAGHARVMFSSTPAAKGEEYLDDLLCERKYSGQHAYCLSKLMMEMVCREMHERYGDPPHLSFNTFYPGAALTKLMLQGTYTGQGKRKGRYLGGKKLKSNLRHDPNQVWYPRVETHDASFRAMADDVYQLESGRSVCDAEVLNNAEARAKLWEDFVEMTGAEWPEPRRGHLPSSSEGA